MPWPLLLMLINTAMSFWRPPMPRCTPYTRPYSTCAACNSPLTSLSRTAAHDASLEGTILMPYFSSNFMTEAITTEAQSVSGMKPILTSFSSGASEPPAHAAERVSFGTMGMIPAAPSIAPVFFMKSLRLFCSMAGMFDAAVDSLISHSSRLSCQPSHKSGGNQEQYLQALNSLAKMIASAISANRFPLLIAILRMRL